MRNTVLPLVLVLAVAAGCQKSKDDPGLLKKAGSAVGEGLTDFASGVGKGIDQQMQVNVELAKGLADAGLSRTVAKSNGLDHGKGRGITVYLVAAKPFKAKLLARALTKEGQEIGRSTADIDLGTDDAKYVTFSFEKEMDTQLVEKYVIDAKK